MATANVFPQSVPHSWLSTFENTQSIHLRQKACSLERLLGMQAASVRAQLEQQAQELVKALIDHEITVNVRLPDQVACYPFQDGQLASIEIPHELQKQSFGGWTSRMVGRNFRDVLVDKLASLEQSSNLAVANAAELLRCAVARHIVYQLLPAGRPVSYLSTEGEEIPSLPSIEKTQAATDADVDPDPGLSSSNAYAYRFFLPHWVSFDENDHLLVNTIQEAESSSVSMQNYLQLLQDASFIAPYFVADEQYQIKRYGILGQLVNQGRALGRYWTREIIQIIERRANSNKLDRGLSISLPYFDDRELAMKMLDFVVIPLGRTMFMPAFVVRAAREEQAKAIRNPALSFSTRKYLLIQLDMLEQAFQAPHVLNKETAPEIS